MKKPYVIAEIGINHNGSIDLAKILIELAKNAGCDFVKFQKRNPEICVPMNQRDVIKETVFGTIKYFDYKKKMEFGKKEFDEIDRYCKDIKMPWFASVWDEDSMEFMKGYDIPFIKVPSACNTDLGLLKKIKESNIPVIISTGMSTKKIIDKALSILGDNVKYILHCVSTYPTPDDEMNMKSIITLKELYGKKYKIGFSNHSKNTAFLIQALTMDAEIIEAHITLDRGMRGTDHRASIGPSGLQRFMTIKDELIAGWGNGELEIVKSEYPVIDKLRRIK